MMTKVLFVDRRSEMSLCMDYDGGLPDCMFYKLITIGVTDGIEFLRCRRRRVGLTDIAYLAQS